VFIFHSSFALLVKLFVVRSSRKGIAEGLHPTSLPVRTARRSSLARR
jgi:hypothetical protein